MNQFLSGPEVLKRLKSLENPQRNYAAMFSSWLGGIVTEPGLMVVPIDDHGFHRGDAVFEAVKCVSGNIYALDRHLERMQTSAHRIELKIPFNLKELHDISVETVRASKCQDAILRMYASRGPGGFTTNPYESVGSQFYLVITPFKPLAPSKYDSGVTAKLSRIQVKEGFFANVKSCNYLPNVMMKKEAVDAGVDFTVSVDEKGFLAEGSTENFAIVDAGGALVVPGFERTLKGITISRAMELAKAELVGRGVVSDVRHGHVTVDDVSKAREAFFMGTTLDCISVTEFEKRKIGDGRPGPVGREILKQLQVDMLSGPLVTSIATEHR